MRAIRLCLMVVVGLTIWHQPVAGAGLPQNVVEPKGIDSSQTEERLFYDNEFVYVAPPTPDLTSNPKLYVNRFRAAPSANAPVSSVSPTPTAKIETTTVATPASPTPMPTPTATYAVLGKTSGQAAMTATPLPPIVAGPSVPAPTVAAPTVSAPTESAPTESAPTALSPTALPPATLPPTSVPVATVAPTATPTPVPPTPTTVAAPQEPVQQTGQMNPAATRFVLGDQGNPLFHEGAFRYTAPATPPPIDDPRFYRGSFTVNEAGHLAPTPAAVPTRAIESQVPIVATAEALVKSKAQEVPAPEVGVTTGVVTYDKLSPSYAAQSPLPIRGHAMYYNPGIMTEVLSYRLQLKQVAACGECVGYVALLRAGDLNRKVWLQWDDGVVEGPFLVIDVAARQHVPSLLARNWVVDVDYRTAMRRGMNRPLPVTVLASPPTVGAQPGAQPTYDNLELMTEN